MVNHCVLYKDPSSPHLRIRRNYMDGPDTMCFGCNLKPIDAARNARVSPYSQPEEAPSASRMLFTMGGFTASVAHEQSLDSQHNACKKSSLALQLQRLS